MKNLKLVKGKKILDLGCSNGKALRFFESEFNLKGEGYDINFFSVMWGKLLNKIKGSEIKLHWKNFFKADLKKYDYIYVYLLPVQMEYIEDWLFENMGKNIIIVSNTFEFKKNQPFEVIKNDKGKGRIFLYKV
ncbi:class I SAM-dependent methyltransferase [Candidatus Gracilibacteria bacterium]|nr:class I SAM-dependent methyltransferase [Candidatus Gracilibacteria bacterium]